MTAGLKSIHFSRNRSQLTCFATWLLTFILNGVIGSNEGDNALEFNVLCRIALTAEKAKDVNSDDYIKKLAKWNTVSDIQEQIQKYLTQANESTEARTTMVIDGLKIEINGGPDKQRLLRLLGIFEGKLEALANHSRDLKSTARQKVELAKQKALAALGEGSESSLASRGAGAVTKLWGGGSEGTSAANRDVMCGATAVSHALAGDSLPHDMICLCADQTSNDKKVCGVSLTGSSNYWGTRTFNGAPATVWSSLAAHCTALSLGKPFGISELQGTLLAFDNALGRRVKSGSSANGKMHWVLGLPKADGTCDGTLAGGACVSYAAGACAASCGATRIKWYENIKEAIQALEDAQQAGEEMNQTDQKAYAILLYAETEIRRASLISNDGGPVKYGSEMPSGGFPEVSKTKTNTQEDTLKTGGFNKAAGAKTRRLLSVFFFI